MIIIESYDNIYRFMDTVNSRPENGCFKKSSHDDDRSFFGTKNWDEAVHQFENGRPEKAEAMRESLNAFKAKTNAETTKARPRNYYHGHAPNVPAAIIGLPKSMRQVHRVPQKVKALTIFWKPTVNCGITADAIEKAGEAVLKLVYALEVRGYRVKLDSTVFSAEKGSEHIIGLVTLKEFKQPLDILKLSFPLTSPSYFRRFGFRWAETVAGVTNKEWAWGYGHSYDKDEFLEQLKKGGHDIANSYVIDVNDATEVKYDPLKLAERVGIAI